MLTRTVSAQVTPSGLLSSTASASPSATNNIACAWLSDVYFARLCTVMRTKCHAHFNCDSSAHASNRPAHFSPIWVILSALQFPQAPPPPLRRVGLVSLQRVHGIMIQGSHQLLSPMMRWSHSWTCLVHLLRARMTATGSNSTPVGTPPSSASVAPTSSPTSTPAAYVPTPFVPGNVVILRLGDATHNASSAGTGIPMPLYLDEVAAATGTLVRTIPLPFSMCTLASGRPQSAPFWWFDGDGWPQLSDNGQFIMFACMSPASLNVPMPDTAATIKRIATVSYAGVVSFPAALNHTGAGSSSLRYASTHTVSSPDGVSVFFV